MQDTDREALNNQQGHWGKMYEENPDMFGTEVSYPARKAVEAFGGQGAKKILELGSGQGRDTFFFVRHGFQVHAVDYSREGLDAIDKKAEAEGAAGSVITVCHDIREGLPFPDDSFDGCYSHMLFCMALTTRELEFLSREVRRVLKPGSLHIYTVRNTTDPHFGTGTDHGDDMWERGGFIVHYYSREKVEHLAEGYEIINVDEFEETKLPKRLFLVTLIKN